MPPNVRFEKSSRIQKLESKPDPTVSLAIDPLLTLNPLMTLSPTQLFSGIYLLELCLIEIFMTVRNTNVETAGIGQVVLITFAATATIIFHLILKKSFTAVLRHIPRCRDDGNFDSVQANKESQAAVQSFSPCFCRRFCRCSIDW